MRCRLYIFMVSLALLLAVPGQGFCRESIRVGVRVISPPYSFMAVKDGEKVIRGYSVDEFVMLGKLLDLEVKFIATGDLIQREQMLINEGSLDFVAHTSRAMAEELNVPWVSVGYSLRHHLYVNKKCRSVTCLRDIEEKKVVAIAGAPYTSEVIVPEGTLWVSSPYDALNMLDQGVVDVFIAPSERVADFIIDRHELGNILKKGVILGEAPMGILFSGRQSHRLEEIRAAMKYLQDTGRLAQLRDKWFGRSYSASWLERYADYIAIPAGIIGLVFIAIVMWNVSLKRHVAQVAADLRRTEQRYQDIIESSPDMIFLVNESGDILHANERAHTFLHFPEGEEANLVQLMALADVDEIRAFMTKVFNDGCDKHEFTMNGAAGHSLEVEIAGRLIQGPLKTEVLACLFARNVTERNRMEEDLIQSERLGIIGKMAASVAHEINNPLGIIQANAEDLIYEEDVSEGVKEGLSAIQRNAIRAGEITKGLLEAASPKPVSEKTLDVAVLIYDAISLLGAKGKGRTINVDVPDAPIFIRGDERALQQVMVNLLFNSLDHMGEGDAVTVVVRKGVCLEGQTVRIVVNDSGKGIPRENLSKIFEPFFTSRRGGFGLGLYITRRMVDRHHGLIFAESVEGKGTSMFLEFPAYSPKEH